MHNLVNYNLAEVGIFLHVPEKVIAKSKNGSVSLKPHVQCVPINLTAKVTYATLKPFNSCIYCIYLVENFFILILNLHATRFP